VKFKVIAVSIAATALSLGMAGSAGASPLSRQAPAPQVTGARLESGLLPASAFGDGFTVTGRISTGNTLWPARAILKPSALSCVKFETYNHIGGFGNTAGATDFVTNPNPAFGDFPNVVLGGDQAALQFGSAQAAASFFSRSYSRYKQCSDFTESYPGGLGLELTTQSLSSTTIGGHKAFQLTQVVDIPSLELLNFYQSTAVVLAGPNMYIIDELNGTNDPVSGSLVSRLISRVQALYRR
jgi:hypothetical protein